jgi:hypothetical protein
VLPFGEDERGEGVGYWRNSGMQRKISMFLFIADVFRVKFENSTDKVG